ncbi:hypothetical protein CASFOL_039348 [Castilleja foliolosa]|uniref:Uncharacterized protein n=1 Tax=Castilleja foliolosa TaxID=1961234 RepID=A0ABD3BID0_9LAMI
MPKGSKKRRADKKKQKNQLNYPSSASNHSHDVKQHDELKINSTGYGLKITSSVERDFEFGAKSNGINGGTVHDDEAAKSHNGRSSSNSSSDSSSDNEEHSRVTEVEEKITLLLGKQEKDEPIILEETEKKLSSEAIIQSVEEKPATVLDQDVLATQETAESSAVTEPLLDHSPSPEKKSSWKSCCGLFEVFSGSGR